MISDLIGILADRGRGSRAYHSDTIPPEIECRDAWGDVLAEASRRGMSVTWVEGYVQIGQGTFQDNEGGAMLAHQALERGLQ
jgi:hypothetical protein